MQEHEAAMNCRDCEDFLDLGIQSFNWLRRAEEELWSTIYTGQRGSDPSITERFDRLYHTWMMPVALAEKWIAFQQSNGYEPDNLHEFRGVCQQVRDIVENRDWANVAEQSRCICQDDEDW
jgi:hypothetical protein